MTVSELKRRVVARLGKMGWTPLEILMIIGGPGEGRPIKVARFDSEFLGKGESMATKKTKTSKKLFKKKVISKKK